MTASRPPAIATWLLYHLVLGSHNEAVTGDLLEEFKSRQSVAWYWRQAIWAIFLSFLTELRNQRLMVGYAAVWTFAVSVVWKHIKMSPQLESVLGWGVSHPWPESIIYVMAIYNLTLAGLLWIGFGLYVAMVDSFNLRCFIRGLFVGFVTTVIGMQLPGLFFAGHYRETALLWRLLTWLPFFVALTLSLWTARARAEAKMLR
jgi:hypothetical protein